MPQFGYLPTTLGSNRNSFPATPNTAPFFVSGSGPVDNTLTSLEYTATEGDTLTQINLYCISFIAASTIEVGVYEWDGTKPTNLVSGNHVINVAQTAGWQSVSVNIPLAAGVDYVLAIANGVNTPRYYYTSLIDAIKRNGQDFPDPFPASGLATINELPYLYADVTSGGAAPTITDFNGGSTGYPSETGTINGSGFGAVEGTVNLDGVAQTVTNWTDTAIDIVIVQGGLNYSDDKTLEVIPDAQ